MRDVGNADMTPQDFKERINEHIRARRDELRGDGSARTSAQLLPEAHAFLSLEEARKLPRPHRRPP